MAAHEHGLWRAGLVTSDDAAAAPETRDLTRRFVELRTRYRGGRRLGDESVRADGPPQLGWVQAVAKVEHAEGRISQLLRSLEEAQTEHITALSEFDGDDRAEDADGRAKQTTAEIIKLFGILDVAVRRIVQDPDDTVMLRNVQRGLACRISELHTRFKAITDRYEQKKKSARYRESRVREYGGQASDAVREWEEQDAHDTKVGKWQEQGLTQQQIDALLHQEAIQREKAKEMENIAEQVDEINAMFKDLGALVEDQGTMLDIVEQNIAATRQRVQEGHQQLKEARKHQKKCSLQ